MIQELCSLIGYLKCSGTTCLQVVSSSHEHSRSTLPGYRKAFHWSGGPNRSIHLLGNRREQTLGDLGHDVNLRIDDFGDLVTHTGAEDHSDFGGVEFVLLLEPSR